MQHHVSAHSPKKNESPDAQMEQQSVHMLKIKEDRLFVSAALHIETAAPKQLLLHFVM